MKKERRPVWPILLVLFGLSGVVLAEIGVRFNMPSWPWLGVACMLFPLSWMVLFIGAIGGLWARRMRFVAGALGALFLSYPHAAQTFGWPIIRTSWGIESPALNYAPGTSSLFQESDEKVDSKELHVLSWNVRQFDRLEWLKNTNSRSEMLTYIEEVAADVVCIQECFLEENNDPWMTKKRLLQASGLSHWAEEFKFGRGHQKLFGLAVMSRHPIIQKSAIVFPNEPNNSGMLVDIELDGDTIRVFNVHLSSIHFEEEDYEAVRTGPDSAERLRLLSRLERAWEKRAVQAKIVAQHVADSPYPVVLMGDFNDVPVSFAAQQFQPYLVDAYSGGQGFLGATYIGDIPGMRIDFVLHSPIMKCRSYETGDVVLSDHRPVSAHLIW
jgi:endonuclease/exonuclease/phosphatase family metal-dependent hydrolase